MILLVRDGMKRVFWHLFKRKDEKFMKNDLHFLCQKVPDLVSFLIFSKEKKMPRKDAKNVIHASCIQWMKEGPSGFFLEKEEN